LRAVKVSGHLVPELLVWRRKPDPFPDFIAPFLLDPRRSVFHAAHDDFQSVLTVSCDRAVDMIRGTVDIKSNLMVERIVVDMLVSRVQGVSVLRVDEVLVEDVVVRGQFVRQFCHSVVHFVQEGLVEVHVVVEETVDVVRADPVRQRCC